MTSHKLSTVTQQLITTYGNTAQNVIQAYRVGGERAISLVDHTFAAAVDKTAERVNANVRAGVVAAEQLVSGFYAKRLSVASDSAEFAVKRVVTFAEFGVNQVASNASRFEKATGTKALSQLAAAAMPAAQAVGQVGVKLEAQSALLVEKVSGAAPARKTAQAAKRKPTAKPAATRTQKAAAKAAKPAAPKAAKAKVAAPKARTAKVAAPKVATAKTAAAKPRASRKAATVAPVAAA